MPPSQTPRVIVFDSGLGGLSVLKALHAAIPAASYHYVADDAFFPYGAKPDDALVKRIFAALAQPIAEYGPDAIVIACNTASTIALPALRARFAMPIIGTVPAIKPAALLSESGLISVLGTSATVRRDYTHGLISEFGQGKRFILVGSARLAALAEAAMMGELVGDDDILAEIVPCFMRSSEQQTDVVVLACTHFPLLLQRFQRLAPWPVSWLDPAPAIARHTATILRDLGFETGIDAGHAHTDIVFTSGKTLSPVLDALFAQHGLMRARNVQSG